VSYRGATSRLKISLLSAFCFQLGNVIKVNEIEDMEK
jgi:hypothetical protein